MLFLALALNAQSSEENSYSWPIEIESENGFVTTLYQPQLESFVADVIEGRMAVTIKPGEAEMVFGALWFKARVSTDLDNRTVLLEKIDIIKTHFPEIVDEEKIQKFSTHLSAEIESWNLEMSLDRILASLDEVDNLKQLSDNINNEAPEIYFRTSPAVLVMIDGEPLVKADDNSGLEYVANTPFFIVKEKGSGSYYLNGGPFWYTSNTVLSDWKQTDKVPSKIEKFAAENQLDEENDSISNSYTSAPEIIIATKASELIMADGDLEYKNVEGTTLLYVENTEADILIDINTQNHYILLAGRWFYSKSLEDGDWKFTEPENLPEEFKKIPEESSMASVRVSIPGTSEAETALLEQSIPQTATIDRKEATVSVSYDGDPKFEKIEGTDMFYAVNTEMTVLKISDMYYVVDDAVWFQSTKAEGPWEVSTVRPDEVDEIPPESPVYNVKYTYIYESTPEVVYVGYTPGYTHCYVYGGVVVYGTGYYYPYWYRYYYYPRPVTYGYGVHYNPYTGWGFTVGYSYGWVSWHYHPYHRHYWGPRGYHAGYRHGYHRGYRRGYHHGYRAGYARGYTAGHRNAQRNVYRHRSSGVKHTGNVRTAPSTRNVNNKARPSTKPNNMYTDRSGNVYQRNQNGTYENRSNRPSTSQQRSQPPSQPSTSPQQRPAQSSQPQNKQNLDRSHQSRQQGSQNYNRSQQYNRSSGSASRPSTGSRPSGGGGRRR